jgi:hypothetical protein
MIKAISGSGMTRGEPLKSPYGVPMAFYLALNRLDGRSAAIPGCLTGMMYRCNQIRQRVVFRVCTSILIDVLPNAVPTDRFLCVSIS